MHRPTSTILMGSVSVPEFMLEQEFFLGGHRMRFRDSHLIEVTDLAIASVACPLEGRAELEGAVMTSWSAELPGPGRSTASANGQVMILGMSPDQFFVISTPAPTAAGEFVPKAVAEAGYVSDQSDNWVALRLEGPLVLPALERICPLDLDPAAFAVGSVARTVMEHIGAIIHREGPDRFLLFSASSSAHSFLHAVATSFRNVDVAQG